jgi:hypothetical protein
MKQIQIDKLDAANVSLPINYMGLNKSASSQIILGAFMNKRDEFIPK